MELNCKLRGFLIGRILTGSMQSKLIANQFWTCRKGMPDIDSKDLKV